MSLSLASGESGTAEGQALRIPVSDYALGEGKKGALSDAASFPLSQAPLLSMFCRSARAAAAARAVAKAASHGCSEAEPCLAARGDSVAAGVFGSSAFDGCIGALVQAGPGEP